MGETHYVGPGLTVGAATLPSGRQIAQEQVWEPDENGTLRLLYAKGDIITDDDAERLSIVDGVRRLPDNADVAPTEKARRNMKDKAQRKPTFEDKAVTPNG